MGQARGTITQEELEKYGGANIMLMNGGSELNSGSASGSISINFNLYWTDYGFTADMVGAGLAFGDLTGVHGDALDAMTDFADIDSYIRTHVDAIATLLYLGLYSGTLPSNCFTY